MEQSISKSAKAFDWRTTKTWFTYRTMLMGMSIALFRLYYYPQIKIKKVGFENVPEGACILVANHISNDDAPIMGAALPNHRHPFFMAKKELFERFGWVYRNLGAFPVYRRKDDWAFDHVGKILAAGQICAIFTEGSRNGEGKVILRRARTGAVRLALRYKVPIVPCAVIGPEKLYEKRFRKWRSVEVKISFGKPVDVSAIVAAEPDVPLTIKRYHTLTAEVMKRVAAMLPLENRGYYAAR